MERIIITLDRQGNFRGASAQDWDGMPLPLSLEQLNAAAIEINAAAINSIAELEVTAATATTDKQTAEQERDALTTQLAEANARIAELTAPPASLTIRSWQAKAILAANGLLSAAEAVIAAMPEGLPKIATISAWANNADFPRNSQTIVTLATALGLTDAQLDEMFAAGAALTI